MWDFSMSLDFLMKWQICGPNKGWIVMFPPVDNSLSFKLMFTFLFSVGIMILYLCFSLLWLLYLVLYIFFNHRLSVTNTKRNSASNHVKWIQLRKFLWTCWKYLKMDTYLMLFHWIKFQTHSFHFILDFDLLF